MTLLSGKALALDLGDVWIGIAISDPLWMIARPLTTTTRAELEATLTQLLTKERIAAIIVGCPITFSGTESSQTTKIKQHFSELQERFSQVNWQLWDERLSSKRAEQVQSNKKKNQQKKQKEESHAIAAAFILDSFLQNHQAKKALEEID